MHLVFMYMYILYIHCIYVCTGTLHVKYELQCENVCLSCLSVLPTSNIASVLCTCIPWILYSVGPHLGR